MRLCSLTQDLKEKRWNVMIELKKNAAYSLPALFSLLQVWNVYFRHTFRNVKLVSGTFPSYFHPGNPNFLTIHHGSKISSWGTDMWTKLTLQPLLKCTYFLISSTCISFETGEEFCVGKRFFRIAANRKGVSAGGEERYKRGFSHAKHTRRLPAIPLGILFRNPPGETVEVLHKWPSFWKRQTSGLKGSAQEMSNFTNTKEGSSLSVGLFWCGCQSSAGHEDVPIPVCSYSLETWSSDSIYFLPLKQW